MKTSAGSQNAPNAVGEGAEPDLNDPYRGAAPAPRSEVVDPCQWLKISSERLSQVRYVFIIQIEDGIPSASQRAALEYSDAVLMGWPESNDQHLQKLDDQQIAQVRTQADCVEKYLRQFRTAERNDDSEAMAESLIRVTENVAQLRKNFQPDFLLPTFAEIRRVVEEEWNEDMAKIAAPDLKGARLRSGFQVEGVADKPHTGD